MKIERSRIHYGPGLPSDVRAVIAPHLDKWEWIVPAWCHAVNVLWNDSNTAAALSITTHYEYRRADLTVCPNFFSLPEKRESNLVHELIHIALAPMANTASDLRNAIAKHAPDVGTWADEMLRHSEESVVVDLADVMIRIGNR